MDSSLPFDTEGVVRGVPGASCQIPARESALQRPEISKKEQLNFAVSVDKGSFAQNIDAVSGEDAVSFLSRN